MSFPKAKIHRFNEEITCAPPPGKYDPKLDTKVKGAVIDKSKRFIDQKIDAGSTESLDSYLTCKKGCNVSSSGSIFRTPQTKKVPHTPNQNRIQCPLQTSTPYLTRSDSSISLDSLNKDKSSNSGSEIHRLEEKLKSVVNQNNSQLLEKTKEISILKEKLEYLCKNNEQLREGVFYKEKILQEYNINLEKLRSDYDFLNTKILTEREEHRKYCEELEGEIQGLKKCIEINLIEKGDLEVILAEKQAVLVTMNDKYLSLETELRKLEVEKDELIALHANEIRALLIKHEVELNSVATAAELNVHVMKNKLESQVKQFATEIDNAQTEIHDEFETKLKDITNDTEMHLQKIKEMYEKCSENVLNIGNIVSSKINEFIMLFKEYDEKYETIVYERNKAEYERDELRVSNLEKNLTIIEIQELADDYKMKLEKSLAKCKKYEITVTKMQETIKALSDRLFASESDVEHLNEVQNVLRLDQIELCKSMAELEKDIINDIVLLKTQLLSKLEMFKSEAAAEIEKLRIAVDEKQKTIEMLLDEIDFYQTKLLEKDEIMCFLEDNVNVLTLENKENNEEIVSLKNEISMNKECIQSMTHLVNELKDKDSHIESVQEHVNRLMNELKDQDNHTESLQEQVNHLVNELKDKDNHTESLQEQVNHLVNELKDKDNHVESLQEQVNHLVNELKDKDNHTESLQEQVNHLVNDLKDKDNHVESLQEQVNHLVNELKDKDNHIESLQEQVNKTTRVTEEKEIYIDEMVSDLVLEKERCTTLENERCKLENKLLATEEELQSLQSDNIEKARFIVEQSLQIDQLKDVQSEMNEQIQILLAEKENFQSMLTEGERKLSCAEASSDSKDNVINNLRRKLEEHLNTIAEKENEIKSLSNTVVTQNRLSELNVLAASMSQIKAENQHLEADVSKKNELICKLHKQNQELSAIYEQYKILSEDNIKLKKELGETNELLEKERSISENLQEKLNAVNENKELKLSTAENDLVDKEHQLDAQRKLIEQLNSRLAELEETVRTLQEERSELIARSDAAQKELKDLDQQLALALGHKNLKQKIRHINQVIEANTEMKLQLDILSAENARLKKKNNKENVNVTNQVISVDNKSPKSVKKPSKLVKATNSPSSSATVLKDRNQL